MTFKPMGKVPDCCTAFDFLSFLSNTYQSPDQAPAVRTHGCLLRDYHYITSLRDNEMRYFLFLDNDMDFE